MSIQKTIYLTESKIGHVPCENCGKMESYNVDGMDLSKEYRITCKECKQSFHVRFEARQGYRKKTKLSGIFVTKDGIRANVKIVDISQTGIGFMTNVEYPDIIKGMRIKLSFRLDNHKRTEVNLDGEAINRKGKLIGIRITGMDEHIRNDIGFYLTPSI